MRSFRIDAAKLAAVTIGPSARWRARASLWILNSELHCVAAYRLGQFAERARTRSPLLGMVLVAVHRAWNRWITHIHHCDISRGARIGPGLLLMHRQGVIIGPSVIGANVVIHHNVTIGQRVARGSAEVPRIGDDVWIGPGAILTGPIEIGDGATISAGAVVSRDVPPRSLVAGNPGRVIAQGYDNSTMINFHVPHAARRPHQDSSVSASPSAA
ncbi:serine O-acetyltransferase [Microbacterium aurum]